MLQGRLIITDLPNTQHCRRGEKKTISGPFDVKHERDQNYTGGKRRRQLWCAFSLSLLTLFPVIIMSGVMGMRNKKKKKDSY